MKPSQKHPPSHTTEIAPGLSSASIHRETYLFEQRINAMERHIRDSGLPNDFFPNVAALCTAHPEWNTLRENPNCYDAVAVLRGLRPVALLPRVDLKRNNAFNDHLLRSIENIPGFVVCESQDSADYIVGSKAQADRVLKILGERRAQGTFSMEYHREFGEALGYSQKAIERFVQSISRGQRALDSAIIETSYLANEESMGQARLPDGRIVVVR